MTSPSKDVIFFVLLPLSFPQPSSSLSHSSHPCSIFPFLPLFSSPSFSPFALFLPPFMVLPFSFPPSSFYSKPTHREVNTLKKSEGCGLEDIGGNALQLLVSRLYREVRLQRSVYKITCTKLITCVRNTSLRVLGEGGFFLRIMATLYSHSSLPLPHLP